MILDKMENASKLPAIWQTDKEKQIGRDARQNVAIFFNTAELKEKKENPLILEMKGKSNITAVGRSWCNGGSREYQVQGFGD